MNLKVLISSRSFTFFSLLLIVVVCLVAYSNTFHVPFQFDDPFNIMERNYVRDIGVFFDQQWGGTGSTYVMRTVGFFTLAVNYRIHGDAFAGYHIINLLIHIFNGFLVYFLVLLTFRTPYFSNPSAPPLSLRGGRVGLFNSQLSTRFISLAAALLFVSHPIQTQAVTYIVQRFTSLATLFYLLSMVMYIKSRLASQRQVEAKVEKDSASKLKPQASVSASALTFFVLSFLSAVLAMKTKEIAFTLPIVIALYEFMFFGGALKKRMLYLVPLLLTMLIIPLGLMGSAKPLGEIIGDVSEMTRVQTVGAAVTRWDYLFTQFRVMVTYIRLLFFPVNQNLDYDYPVYHSFFDPNVFLSFLFLLSIFGIGVYFLYRSRVTPPSPPYLRGGAVPPLRVRGGEEGLSAVYFRLIAFGIFWFFITLSVESSIIPIADVIFEHRLYLPSVGFFIAATASSFMIYERLKGKRKWVGNAALGGFIIVVFVLTGAAYERNTVWQSELSLWSDVLRKSPAKVRALNNVGFAFMNRGDVDKAAEMYTSAIAIDPYVASPHYNLGKTYEKKGRYDEAIEEYKKAVSLAPDFADAYFDLGVAYALQGMREEAIMHYKTAVSLRPDFARVHFNLGVIYLGKNLAKEAVEEFEAALRSDPSLDVSMFLEYARRMQKEK
jgi:Tfp pilus assembly protein PilF